MEQNYIAKEYHDYFIDNVDLKSNFSYKYASYNTMIDILPELLTPLVSYMNSEHKIDIKDINIVELGLNTSITTMDMFNPSPYRYIITFNDYVNINVLINNKYYNIELKPRSLLAMEDKSFVIPKSNTILREGDQIMKKEYDYKAIIMILSI